MIYHKNLIYITLILMLACETFAGLIQWSSVSTRQSNQLITVFEDSNVEIENCGSEYDVLEIEDIKVVPATIVPGREFTIEATGKLKEEVTDGAYVDVTVKAGRIQIIRKTYDLCKTIAEKEDNEIRCPIPAGDIKVSQKFTLQKEIPRARFFVSLMAYTAEDEDLGCLKAKVDFIRKPWVGSSTVPVNNYFYN